MESYNSQMPMAFYQVGKPYMFYSCSYSNAYEASEKEAAQYGEYFRNAAGKVETSEAIGASHKADKSKDSHLTRYVGIVVAKDRNSGYSAIKVMFSAILNGKQMFMVKKYIVEQQTAASTDGKNLMAAVSTVSIEQKKYADKTVKNTGNGIKAQKKTERRVGGITEIGGGKRVGGITEIVEETASESRRTVEKTVRRVGGITEIED